ncbi:hypothetical protein OQZ33_15200 [Pedobacter sp. MC2016-05]|uniref:hypothetical protein n=1 Tax=Pedobacter sp. MC2016-05 TaxID=2994474 RepID=UPI002247D1F9|nr:hypothetical protein [Pedobacter sp. MC2016-05]MCX2475679.1 hypothetical protein [Pedobacter sp. MC2016-05]
MYRKDLITAEIQKLAEVLARIMGLKLEGKIRDAQAMFDETMEKSFTLATGSLEDTDLAIFKNWLESVNFAPEKLDSLSEFLYYELGVSAERNKLIAPKLNMIYNYLSDKHKVVHLVNLHRQKTIQQYI